MNPKTVRFLREKSPHGSRVQTPHGWATVYTHPPRSHEATEWKRNPDRYMFFWAANKSEIHDYQNFWSADDTSFSDILAENSYVDQYSLLVIDALVKDRENPAMENEYGEITP